MGARLMDYYAQVAKQYGAAGRMKLAMITNLSSIKAQDEPDSPQNIEKFERALAQIKAAGGK